MTLQMGTPDLTEKNYEFNCKILSKEVSFEARKKNGELYQDTSKMFYLLPDESTQASMFLTAWLPSCEGEVYELVAYLNRPFNMFVRLGLTLPNKNVDKIHLNIMSVNAEERAESMIKQKIDRVLVHTLKASEEPDYPV